MVNGKDHVFAERNGKLERLPIAFDSTEDLEGIASFCREKKIPAATIYWKYWSYEAEEIFEKQGIHLHVYTVNDRNQARKYIAAGAEGICTDFLTTEDLW